MKINFNNHITVEHGYLMFPLPNKRLRKFPEIYNRICACIYFASKIDNECEKYGVDNSAVQAAFFRSALNELYVLEDFIGIRYPLIEKSTYEFYQSSDPILHMARLLRNYNVHISPSKLVSKSMKVKTLLSDDDFDIDVNYVLNLNIDSIRNVRGSKNYSDLELTEMIRVFDEQQHEFGISTLIIRIAISYFESLEMYLNE